MLHQGIARVPDIQTPVFLLEFAQFIHTLEEDLINEGGLMLSHLSELFLCVLVEVPAIAIYGMDRYVLLED